MKVVFENVTRAINLSYYNILSQHFLKKKVMLL